MNGVCRCERLGPAGAVFAGAVAWLPPCRTRLVAAVGEPLRVLEFGTEQVAESRAEVREGLEGQRPGRRIVGGVCARALPESGLVLWTSHGLSGKQAWTSNSS